MKLLLVVLLTVLFVGIVFFTINNFGTRVPVTLLNSYADIELSLVFIWAVLFGMVLVGVYAWAEGFSTRMTNRRLTKEIRRLETEINYLRTQPGPDRPPELTTSQSVNRLPAAEPAPEPSSAPVYESEPDGGPPDPDDEMYTGGRAV
jgi:uncharacterized integral membrane protein